MKPKVMAPPRMPSRMTMKESPPPPRLMIRGLTTLSTLLISTPQAIMKMPQPILPCMKK